MSNRALGDRLSLVNRVPHGSDYDVLSTMAANFDASDGAANEAWHGVGVGGFGEATLGQNRVSLDSKSDRDWLPPIQYIATGGAKTKG
jgi:hypothetical protein